MNNASLFVFSHVCVYASFSGIFPSRPLALAVSISPNGGVDVTVNSTTRLTCSYVNLLHASDKFHIMWKENGTVQMLIDQNCNILIGLSIKKLNMSCPDLRQQTLIIIRLDLSFHNTKWTCHLKKILIGDITRYDSNNSATINVRGKIYGLSYMS